MPEFTSSPTDSPLRMLAFGAGALGTYIAGSLALHGYPVVFIEQPQVAAELRRNGLRLTILGQTHHILQPRLVGSLDEALQYGPFDLALFALKSFDTRAALESLGPALERMPPVLCLQNGVENEALLAEYLGKERVIAGTVTSAVGRRAAGDILLERLRGVGLWAGHRLSRRLAAALNQAGLNARLYARAGDMKWSKMLTNLLANASSAILDMTPTEVYAHPRLFRLEAAQLREALRVMAASGIRVVDLPGSPVRLLAVALRGLPVDLARLLLRRRAGSARGAKMPSFHIDLHSGRGKSEVDYLNGAVVRLGERLGVPTPANRLLNETLLGLTRGAIPLETFARQPEKLLDLFKLNLN